MTVLDLITKLHSMPPKARVYLDMLDEPDPDGKVKLLFIDDVDSGLSDDGEPIVTILPILESPNFYNN